MSECPNTDEQEQLVEHRSTQAENILAWKDLLSSSEAKGFVDSVLEKSTLLFGRSHGARVVATLTNMALMATAFICIGLLAYNKLISDGTTGVLAGIVIGYFFKKDS